MKLKKVSWIPAVIVMVIIFAFSSKPAVSSNESSLTIASQLLVAYENTAQVQFDEGQRDEILETINFFVRKGSHFCEYALLAVTLAFHLYFCGFRKGRLFFLPVILSAIYAATDEFHQTFVPGRSGQLGDVLIDTTGAVAGMLFFFLVLRIYNALGSKWAKFKV
ncbi:MAG TPA: VanZ family protein [Clostridiales bacterium]|nr:VanZ family protein [Clostridiales bacterium]